MLGHRRRRWSNIDPTLVAILFLLDVCMEGEVLMLYAIKGGGGDILCRAKPKGSICLLYK